MRSQKFGGTTKSITVFFKKAYTFRGNNLQHKSSKFLVQRESVYYKEGFILFHIFRKGNIYYKKSFDREKKLLLISLQEIDAQYHSTFILKMSWKIVKNFSLS